MKHTLWWLPIDIHNDPLETLRSSQKTIDNISKGVPIPLANAKFFAAGVGFVSDCLKRAFEEDFPLLLAQGNIPVLKGMAALWDELPGWGGAAWRNYFQELIDLIEQHECIGLLLT